MIFIFKRSENNLAYSWPKVRINILSDSFKVQILDDVVSTWLVRKYVANAIFCEGSDWTEEGFPGSCRHLQHHVFIQVSYIFKGTVSPDGLYIF